MPETGLTFEVTFHGPIRVGRGRAAPGVDDTVDPSVIVPGSSLKGLMRAEAVMLVGDGELVGQVFGATAHPSPWHWDDIRADADGPDDAVRVRARIRIDSDAGTVVDGGLFTAEYRWPRTALFTVRQFLALTDDDRRRHEVVLWAAALSVHSIGADRNRGYGWVDIARAGREPDDAFLDQAADLAGVGA